LATAVLVPEGFAAPPDGYRSPEWPRYARTVYFDAYSAPLCSHTKECDAKRVLDSVVRLGGDAPRCQPIRFVTYRTIQASPARPGLASRNIIEEAASSVWDDWATKLTLDDLLDFRKIIHGFKDVAVGCLRLSFVSVSMWKHGSGSGKDGR
jgi:hypothetical protein